MGTLAIRPARRNTPMATKTVTALDRLSRYSLKLRPCIIEGKVSGKGVTVKVTKSGKDSLDKYLAEMKLEAKLIVGSANVIAVIPIDKFNAATVEIDDTPVAPAPVDLSEFEEEEEENEEEEEAEQD
jgi:hypothetical protein